MFADSNQTEEKADCTHTRTFMRFTGGFERSKHHNTTFLFTVHPINIDRLTCSNINSKHLYKGNFFSWSLFPPLYSHLALSPHSVYARDRLISFLISAMAFAGFRPFGQVLEQFRIVWHLYRLMLFSNCCKRSAFLSSRESASQR